MKDDKMKIEQRLQSMKKFYIKAGEMIDGLPDAIPEKTREMLLFFYYPSDEYISYLMTVDELEFLDEIDCQDLFDGKNPRERILVFQMGEE